MPAPMDLTLLPLLLLATPFPPTGVTPLHAYVAATGPPTYQDVSLACMGMQTPLSAAALCRGEYPACAAMTTGHVFRVENQATVMYLQKIGRTGSLVTLEVVQPATKKVQPTKALLYLPFCGVLWGLASLVWCQGEVDVWFWTSVALLLGSRVWAIATHRPGGKWHGASEPGVEGDLLVLLSEDRWVRLRGMVDDLKAVTAGGFVPDSHAIGDGLAGLMVYLAAVVLAGARDRNKLALTAYVLLGHASLALWNSRADEAVVNGRTIRRLTTTSDGPAVKPYRRRLDMAEELVRQVGRTDFAVRLGLINPDHPRAKAASEDGPAETSNDGPSGDDKNKHNLLANELVTM
jgi:hypothetical protein